MEKLVCHLPSPISFVPLGPRANTSLVIDLDRGIVTGGIGDFSITKVKETQIEFKDKANSENDQVGMQGRMDRITGFISVTISDGYERLTMYDLICKPANPLF